MNYIDIRYSYFSYKAEGSINRENISPYSELASILNRPFLDSFNFIIPELDKEIYDDYEVNFYGSKFQYELLLRTIGNSEFCKAVHYHESTALYSQKELMDRLSRLCDRCEMRIEKPVDITVYNACNVEVPSAYKIVDRPNADIGIFSSSNEVEFAVRIPVVIADEIGIQNIRGRVCLLLPREKFYMFWEYIALELVNRPLIAEYVGALRYAKLTEVQRVEIESLTNNVPKYYIGDVPATIDLGKKVLIEFISFPETAFSLKSENNNIILCNATALTAQADGTTSISIVNEKNEIIAQRQITVIHHQYVEEIRILPRFEYLKRGERNRLDVVAIPMNAEDANKMIWKVSDPRVIQVDDSGNIFGLEVGKATITITGVNAKATLEVEVKPAMQKIEFEKQAIRIKTGKEFILECIVTPSTAPTENFVWELDNRNIASINQSRDGKKCQIIASKEFEGKGNIRCYDPISKCGAICNIEVFSKVKMSIWGKLAVVCCLLGFLWEFLFPVSIFAGIIGMIVDKEPERKAVDICFALLSIILLVVGTVIAMS